jgi:hypothetical protein
MDDFIDVAPIATRGIRGREQLTGAGARGKLECFSFAHLFDLGMVGRDASFGQNT